MDSTIYKHTINHPVMYDMIYQRVFTRPVDAERSATIAVYVLLS